MAKVSWNWPQMNVTGPYWLYNLTLVRVMAWCHQARSIYQSQCWPRFMSLYGVIRPLWVKWWLANTMTALFLLSRRPMLSHVSGQVPKGRCFHVLFSTVIEQLIFSFQTVIGTNFGWKAEAARQHLWYNQCFQQLLIPGDDDCCKNAGQFRPHP